MPSGVFPRKNPDFYIDGFEDFFEGKSLLNFEGGDNKGQKQCIENHYKAAKEQAINMVFDVPTNISRDCLDKTIRNILSRTSKERTIIVFYNGEGLVYKK